MINLSIEHKMHENRSHAEDAAAAVLFCVALFVRRIWLAVQPQCYPACEKRKGVGICMT